MTVGAAVVLGLLWVVSLVVGESGVLATLLSVLTGVIMAGGVAMGITYLAAVLAARREDRRPPGRERIDRRAIRIAHGRGHGSTGSLMR